MTGGRTVTSVACQVRAASAADARAVHEVHARAFPSDAEARLVDALRDARVPTISLVAERAGHDVVGHILFSPVWIGPDEARSQGLGLGPLAVLPELQRRGVGAALVEAGLAACRAAGEPLVVVLGHPDYYPRFGFEPAWKHGLFYGVQGPNPSFMVCELARGALHGRSGRVRYHAAFEGL